MSIKTIFRLWQLAAAMIILAVFAKSANASDHFALKEGVYQGLAVCDMLQTMQINNKGGYEMSPILGKHPSDLRIGAQFVATGVAHYLVARALYQNGFSKTGDVFEYLSIGFRVTTITRNYEVGYQIKF